MANRCNCGKLTFEGSVTNTINFCVSASSVMRFSACISVDAGTASEFYLRATPNVVWLVPDYETFIQVESNTNWKIN